MTDILTKTRWVVIGLCLAVVFAPLAKAADKPKLTTATFAGGCFWCMEKPFEDLPGVKSAISGYSGGNERKPTYEDVSAGKTGHTESVQVSYDPTKVTYAQLLQVFWHNIDPTTADRQFCDKGNQYRSAIFFQDEEQKRLAEESKKEKQAELAAAVNRPIVTEIVPFVTFWPAEDYHQDFYKKNPLRYNTYRMGCGRDARLKQLWGEKAGH
jgi:peptide-methionine (S)-S-oxide reductase